MSSRSGSILLITIVALAVSFRADAGEISKETPAALVQEFYEKHPHELEGGLPEGEDLDWLGNYLSDRLLARFRAALDYQHEWIRKNPDRPPYYLKPPFADGVHFTGVPDVVHSFEVLDTQSPTPETWHVRIRFSDPSVKPWDALVVVTMRRSRYVIDDVIFLPMEPGDPTWTLYESLDTTEPE